MLAGWPETVQKGPDARRRRLGRPRRTRLYVAGRRNRANTADGRFSTVSRDDHVALDGIHLHALLLQPVDPFLQGFLFPFEL